MRKRSSIVMLCGALLMSALAGGSAKAGVTAAGTSYLTFSGPVRLPGVTLGAGTYVFERAAPTMNSHVVRVTNLNRSESYYMGFTYRVPRPAGLRADHQILFLEGPRGSAPAIDTWFPVGESTGEQFIYTNR